MLLVLALFAGLFAWDGWRILASADELEAHAAGAQQAVSERDADALASEVTALQASADEFASHTTGVHWTIAGWIPWVKDQTVPLQQAGASVAVVSTDALGPLADLDDLSALEVPPIEQGRIDPYFLEPYREVLASSAQTLHGETAELAEVSLGSTIGAVREPFLTLESQLATLTDLVQGAHVAAEVLPSMLGAEGPRSYIVMVQNNAEPRSSGGIPGAVLELTVDDGRMSLGRYISAASMRDPENPVAALTEDEVRVFTERMVWYPQDVNFTPEYPRAAEIMAAFWERETGESPEAVISIDPVALQQMLSGMEPVDIDGVEITDDNLADVMLNKVYFAFDEPAEQDAFFSRASLTLFGQLFTGSTSVVAGTESAIEQGRFLVWSATDAEQDLLETTDIAGDFIARSEDLGVFLSDGSGSKIGYYIDTELSVVDHLCESDGSLNRQALTYRLTHTYDEAIDDLPWYVGGGDVYVPSGEFHANVRIVPPVGMGVTHFTRDGQADSLNGEQLHTRDIATARVVLLPGETTTLEFEVAARNRGLVNESIAQTPGPKLNVYSRAVDTERDDC
ncbi:DUF4012 domain-containing protein [Demequina sp. NBRC 110056]|uniref:DUF4012 domain-containing protein n=1 Tax=Demequina sp. NBRC 110056 TaxID=1570345 RepID=UPI0013566595|nr:DUF4012 domain-containing protein [Demequina sp. NBRC 110056]